MDGRVEIMSMEFAVGWASVRQDGISVVTAMLDGVTIGVASANLKRDDLAELARTSDLRALAYLIVYRQSVPADRVRDVEIYLVGRPLPLQLAVSLQVDRAPPLRIFVLGSPRSGTSQLGQTLAGTIGLPWLGECHGAPLFHKAAQALVGEPTSVLAHFIDQQGYRDVIVEIARRAYYFVHASASFVDKTPGVGMIASVPFIYDCFPGAKFIYIQRNGISNVLSRMMKFGGSFNEHCADWAAAVKTWHAVRGELPHYLELNQEDMLADPDGVAGTVACYLGIGYLTEALAGSLRDGSREHTGAGVGRSTIAQTGWSETERNTFCRICGPVMEQLHYSMEVN